MKDLDLADLLEVKAVSAVRHDQRQLDSARSMSVITTDELRLKNFRMLGVTAQETNYGGGAPIIGGMVGNRILLRVDGVRLNGGSYRLGPMQYLNTIDIGQVERIEVKGLGPVTVALENLTNKSYRWHGSGIDAPATNPVLGITRSLP